LFYFVFVGKLKSEVFDRGVFRADSEFLHFLIGGRGYPVVFSLKGVLRLEGSLYLFEFPVKVGFKGTGPVGSAGALIEFTVILIVKGQFRILRELEGDYRLKGLVFFPVGPAAGKISLLGLKFKGERF